MFSKFMLNRYAECNIHLSFIVFTVMQALLFLITIPFGYHGFQLA